MNSVRPCLPFGGEVLGGGGLRGGLDDPLGQIDSQHHAIHGGADERVRARVVRVRGVDGLHRALIVQHGPADKGPGSSFRHAAPAIVSDASGGKPPCG